MEIKIDTNFKDLPIWINQNIIKQATFATSVALYDTAVDVKNALIEDLPKSFTIRNGWVAKGIRIKPTSSKAIRKTGAGMAGMQVEVGTVDAFMQYQELGGVKQPKRKAKRLAIPVRNPQSEIIDKKKWPKALLGKPGSKFFMWERADGRLFVFQRLTRARYPIKLKYSFAESVKIPPRWNMRKTANEVVAKNYQDNFKRAFEHALANPKK